jgi:hypothetical protein
MNQLVWTDDSVDLRPAGILCGALNRPIRLPVCMVRPIRTLTKRYRTTTTLKTRRERHQRRDPSALQATRKMLVPGRLALTKAAAYANGRQSKFLHPPARPPARSAVPARRLPASNTRQSSSSPSPPRWNANGSGAQLSDAEMARRLLRSQRVWWWLGGVSLAGVTLVAFAPELKVGVSKHTAEVASRSLQDETLQSNTRELASQIVQTVLNDPKVLDQASQFLQRVRTRSSAPSVVRWSA